MDHSLGFLCFYGGGISWLHTSTSFGLSSRSRNTRCSEQRDLETEGRGCFRQLFDLNTFVMDISHRVSITTCSILEVSDDDVLISLYI